MENVLKNKIDPLLLSVYQKTVADLMQNTEEVQRLNTKLDNLRDSIPHLTAYCEQLSADKNRVLADCAIDNASDSDLATARGKCDEAARNLVEKEELLQAVNAALRAAQSKSQALQNKKNEAYKKIWANLQINITEQIRKDSGYLFQCLEVCAQKLGYSSQGNPFVGTAAPALIELMRQIERDIFPSTAK